MQVKFFGNNVENNQCGWHVSTSWMQRKNNFQVIKVGPNHTCKKATHKNSRLSAKWLARHYMERVKLALSWKVSKLKNTVWDELRLKATMHVCFRALSICHRQIEGDFKVQYKRFWDYVVEIKKANTRNTCFLKVKEGSIVFDKLYICFDALKKGWKDRCRPVLGVDGCFLKGCIEGQILVAMDADGNNQMFPIACKGLVEASKRILPQVEHRCCARHIYANFKKKFNGIMYRKHFWIIANATTRNMFSYKLGELKEIDEEAIVDLEGRDPTWSKAWFKLQSKCDYVTNNITEIFNGSIIEDRHKPILGILEDIREVCMKRNIKKRESIKNIDILLCPHIQKVINKKKEAAAKWNCVWNGRGGYEVKIGNNPLGDKYIVRMDARSCSCRAWQLSGILCEHVITAIWEMRDIPEGYVSHWYKKDTYLKSYNHTMEMLNGPNEWPRQGKEPIKPLELRKWRGKPCRKRRREEGETQNSYKVSRRAQEQRCSNCSQTGHNKHHCQNTGVSVPVHLRYKDKYKAPHEIKGRGRGRGQRG